MPDAGSIADALALIAGDLRDLNVIAKRAPTDTITGRHQQRTERLLERTIGRMIDVNGRVGAATGQSPPRDDYASFVALAHAGVLAQDVADRMAASADLRTQIIHGHAALDATKIQGAVETIVADGPVYLKAIGQYVESRSRG